MSHEPDLDALCALITTEAVFFTGADSAAVLRRRARTWRLIAASDERATRAADITIRGGERRMHPTASLGWRSTCSVPLVTPDLDFGSLELYFDHNDAGCVDLTQPEVTVAGLASLFAQHVSIQLSHRLAVQNLEQAIAARHRTGQAQGMLMARYGLTADAAFEVLRRHSQDNNVKLRHVAEMIITTETLPAGRVRSSRDRHDPPSAPEQQR